MVGRYQNCASINSIMGEEFVVVRRRVDCSRLIDQFGILRGSTPLSGPHGASGVVEGSP